MRGKHTLSQGAFPCLFLSSSSPLLLLSLFSSFSLLTWQAGPECLCHQTKKLQHLFTLPGSNDNVQLVAQNIRQNHPFEGDHPSANPPVVSVCAPLCCKNLCCASRFCTGGMGVVGGRSEQISKGPGAMKKNASSGAQSEAPRQSWKPGHQQHHRARGSL